MSGYPNLKEVHDPEGYFSNLVSILSMYEEIDARVAVDVVADGCPFPPTRYDLRQACEKAKAGRTVPSYANQYDQRSRAQLAERERERQAAEKEPLEVRKAVVADFMGFLRDLKLTGKDPRQAHSETPETVRAKLGLSQEAWDALPDQPKDAGYWKGVR
ncbi:MAG TPA: hypothetical protein VN325_23135 [Steroidobacteraceae bacterium]|nr:hypothetical protein [Steroidobacteraceae bacterium]